MITLEDYMEKMQAFKEQGEKRKEFYSKQRKRKLAKIYRDARKDKKAEYDHLYYLANKERITEIKKQWRIANKDKVLEYHRRWQKANKEKIAEYKRRNREKYREKNLEYQKQDYATNKEKIDALQKEDYATNREKIAEQRKQYRDAGTKTQTEVEQPKTVAPAKKERTEKKSYKETMKEIDYNIRYGEKLQLPKDFYDMWA